MLNIETAYDYDTTRKYPEVKQPDVRKYNTIRWLVLRSDTDSLEGIEKYKQLERLTAYGTKVKNLLPLAKMKKLKKLGIDVTPVKDISPLAGNVNLEVLSLGVTKVADISPLAGLKKIKALYLNQTLVKDLSPLSDLHDLEVLSINSLKVSIKPLLELPKLKIVFYVGAKISAGELKEFEGLRPNIFLNNKSPKDIYKKTMDWYNKNSYYFPKG